MNWHRLKCTGQVLSVSQEPFPQPFLATQYRGASTFFRENIYCVLNEIFHVHQTLLLPALFHINLPHVLQYRKQVPLFLVTKKNSNS